MFHIFGPLDPDIVECFIMFHTLGAIGVRTDCQSGGQSANPSLADAGLELRGIVHLAANDVRQLAAVAEPVGDGLLLLAHQTHGGDRPAICRRGVACLQNGGVPVRMAGWVGG